MMHEKPGSIDMCAKARIMTTKLAKELEVRDWVVCLGQKWIVSAVHSHEDSINEMYVGMVATVPSEAIRAIQVIVSQSHEFEIDEIGPFTVQK